MRDLNQDNAIAAVVKTARQFGSHLTRPPVKKPVLSIDEPEPKKALRADRPPTDGFTVIVDGHFKSEFETLDAAEASGRKLKSTYPMLQIEIYDAATMGRTLLSLNDKTIV
jgi:hypothetical protein